jgi:hypothetical protein
MQSPRGGALRAASPAEDIDDDRHADQDRRELEGLGQQYGNDDRRDHHAQPDARCDEETDRFETLACVEALTHASALASLVAERRYVDLPRTDCPLWRWLCDHVEC